MKLWLPLLLSLFVIAAAPVLETAAWKAGAASAKITPEKSMWMAGYAARTKPSESVELDLFAKPFALTDQEGGRFVLVTLDLIGVPRNLRLAVAERAKKEHGIEPANLAINASHTHSGPELRTSRLHGADDVAQRELETAEYTTALENTILRLIGEALEKSVPAHLDNSHARCGFAMNRRTPDGNGGWSNFPNPAGPVDQSVRFEGERGGWKRDRGDLWLCLPLHDAGASEIQRRLHVPEGWKPASKDGAWSLYERAGQIIGVFSTDTLGLFCLLGKGDGETQLRQLIAANPDASQLKRRFVWPGGGTLDYDLHAEKDRWVIVSEDDKPVNRDHGAWPLMAGEVPGFNGGSDQTLEN